MGFNSEIRQVGRMWFPQFAGVRAMMLPVRLEDPSTVPWPEWRKPFEDLVSLAPVQSGVGYLTIDEARIRKGETHRRPGLHVDGIGPDGRAASWGGGGYAANGMLVASDIVGCRGWNQEFGGRPAPNGDCSHLASQCELDAEVVMLGGHVYWCSPLAVHAALPMQEDTERTFVRLSMPSECPWYEGYTRSPCGVEPTGPIHPFRADFMGYRP